MVFCIPKQSLVKARHAPPELQLPLVLLRLPLVVLPREVIGFLHPQTEPRRGPPALPGALGCLETLATVPHGRGGRGTAAPDLLGGGLWGGRPEVSQGSFWSRGGVPEVRLARGAPRWNRAGLGDPLPGVPRGGPAWGSAGVLWKAPEGRISAVPGPFGTGDGSLEPGRPRGPFSGGPAAGVRLGVRGGSLGALRAAGRSAIFGGTLSSGAQSPGHGPGASPWVPCPGKSAALWPRGATAPPGGYLLFSAGELCPLEPRP